MSAPPETSSKSVLRAAALARRDALSVDARNAAARAVAARAFPVNIGRGAVVAGYCPIRSEFDPCPLMQALADRGARLALPVIAARGEPLKFRAWSPDAAMAAGPFGIREPLPDAPRLAPDVLLVPMAAFDRAGHRIGYGGGYYDRTIAQLRTAKPLVTIGVAFAIQEIEQVPALSHDVRLDCVLTEDDTIDFRS